jgi:hypothetical protein
MTKYLFPRFLEDRAEYEHALEHWNRLWDQVDPIQRDVHEWRSPWLNAGPRELQDGNPIFTAVSDKLRKGLRVIQSPPNTSASADFVAWVDTFGGGVENPDSITELVISSVLSSLTSTQSLRLMTAWVLSGGSTTLPVTTELYLLMDLNNVYAAA